MPQLLIEFFCEEIPSRMQERACADLISLMEQRGLALGLTAGGVRAYITPRRLALVAEDVPLAQAATTEERRGPRVDAPQAAVDGFLASTGLNLDQCHIRETPKGQFYFATLTKPPQETVHLLPSFVSQLIKTFPWPKSMRWRPDGLTWVRPLHSVLCIFNDTVVDLKLDIPSVSAATGHRFLAPRPVFATDFASYQAGLREAFVMVDPLERRHHIQQQLESAAASHQLMVREDNQLLKEVTGLVEWPHVLMGKIDAAFMTLPEEILITVMRHHQRYFALQDGAGSLVPFFITIANVIPEDGGTKAIRGNEWVLRARLADAKFFWESDLKTPLEDHASGLSRLVFHTKLGTMADKIKRTQALACTLNTHLALNLSSELIGQAASLIKADLTTQTVIEFPELQGQIGRSLALAQGKPMNLARAICDHYSPQGPDQPAPQCPLGILMGLGDKLDTLAGFFLMDEKPTGSKDPYALRRAALGIIRTVLENRLAPFSLSRAFQASVALYPQFAQAQGTAVSDLTSFFTDRLRTYFRDRGYEHDVVEACLAGMDSLVQAQDKIIALHGFMESDQGQPLLQSYKRACNILRQAATDNDVPTREAATVDITLFQEPEEGALYQTLLAKEPLIEAELATSTQTNFIHIFQNLAEFSGPLSAFFDRVTVNARETELRQNRLKLLTRIAALFDQAADFSLLEG